MRPICKTISTGLTVLALLAASTLGASAQTVLRYVPHADLKNLDPIRTTAGITLMHGYMV